MVVIVSNLTKKGRSGLAKSLYSELPVASKKLGTTCFFYLGRENLSLV
jgi:hypothetical protein